MRCNEHGRRCTSSRKEGGGRRGIQNFVIGKTCDRRVVVELSGTDLFVNIFTHVLDTKKHISHFFSNTAIFCKASSSLRRNPAFCNVISFIIFSVSSLPVVLVYGIPCDNLWFSLASVRNCSSISCS